MGALTTEGISILINESGGGCRDNRRYFNTTLAKFLAIKPQDLTLSCNYFTRILGKNTIF